MRKLAGYFCYIIASGIYIALLYTSYLSYSQKITYELGFLVCLPTFIAGYWFSTFYTQLLDGCDKKGTPLVGKVKWRVLATIINLLRLTVVIIWIGLFVYIYLYTSYLNQKGG